MRHVLQRISPDTNLKPRCCRSTSHEYPRYHIFTSRYFFTNFATLATPMTLHFAPIVLFSMAIGHGELMQECFSKHSRMGTARTK